MSLCVMPGCSAICDSPLCEKHQIELRQRRLRAEVLELVKARPSPVARPQKNPFVVEPGDYHSWDKAPYVIEPVVPAEPLLLAQPCPEDRMPSSVRSALKQARANGWATSVTYAISHDEIHSVAFRAHKGVVRVASRHEGDGTKTFGFKSAWWQGHDRAQPTRLGWREMASILGGLDWAESQRNELRQAILTAMDCGLGYMDTL